MYYIRNNSWLFSLNEWEISVNLTKFQEVTFNFLKGKAVWIICGSSPPTSQKTQNANYENGRLGTLRLFILRTNWDSLAEMSSPLNQVAFSITITGI